MGKIKAVPGQAFDITSIWISDDGHFEFVMKEDMSIVRTGPTIKQAEEFVTLIHEIITTFQKHSS